MRSPSLATGFVAAPHAGPQRQAQRHPHSEARRAGAAAPHLYRVRRPGEPPAHVCCQTSNFTNPKIICCKKSCHQLAARTVCGLSLPNNHSTEQGYVRTTASSWVWSQGVCSGHKLDRPQTSPYSENICKGEHLGRVFSIYAKSWSCAVVAIWPEAGDRQQRQLAGRLRPAHGRAPGAAHPQRSQGGSAGPGLVTAPMERAGFRRRDSRHAHHVSPSPRRAYCGIRQTAPGLGGLASDG